MTILANKRVLNLLGSLACAGMMAYALYSQHVLGLDPCPLCIFQRVAVIALGVVFLLAALQGPGRVGGYVYAVLAGAAALAAMGVAGRHVWLQNLPPDKVPACGPGLDFMLESFPFAEVLDMVLNGSGECAEVSWSLLGVSMPGWVFIAAGALGIYGITVNVRRDALAGLI